MQQLVIKKVNSRIRDFSSGDQSPAFVGVVRKKGTRLTTKNDSLTF
jgi:hypothetical protein